MRVPIGRGKHESALFPTLATPALRAALRGAGPADDDNASRVVLAIRAVVVREGSHAGVHGNDEHVTLSRVEVPLLRKVCASVAADAAVKKAAAAPPAKKLAKPRR